MNEWIDADDQHMERDGEGLTLVSHLLRQQKHTIHRRNVVLEHLRDSFCFEIRRIEDEKRDQN